MKPWLARRIAETPNAPALSAGDDTLDYRQLAEAAARRAAVLESAGIGRGDRVLMSPGSDPMEAALWIHALFWRGATLVPVYSAMPSGRLADLIEWLAPAARLRFDREPAQQSARALSRPAAPCPEIRCDSVAAGATTAGVTKVSPAAELDADDVAVILLTSGSTAAPKAVPLTLAQLAASASAVAERLGRSPHDRWLACLPLHHVGGLAILIRAVLAGASVRLHARFDAAGVIRELCTEPVAGKPVTLASLVPTMLVDLLEAGPREFRTSLRAVLIGGAPAPGRLLLQARERGLPVLPTWGMTEAGSQLATLAPAAARSVDFAAREGLVGKPLAGVEVRRRGPPGEGALQVRGPMLFGGYVDGDVPGPDADGWFTTGDLGEFDDRGNLYITGRAAHLIISGGENIDLRAVEARIRASGLVADVALAAVDDPRWSQRIGAVVVPAAPDTADSVESLATWARAHLEPAERPVRWVRVDGIPAAETGKPCRDTLLKLLETRQN
ncbi:MAG: AMP-binding protein [Wenzhouxiangellaceae bacterium]|nr:AMP-binding protein [Wenzhouxiangellaceae bacterium]